jgi:hypothetical protein
VKDVPVGIDGITTQALLNDRVFNPDERHTEFKVFTYGNRVHNDRPSTTSKWITKDHELEIEIVLPC